MVNLLDGETHKWWEEKAKKWTAGSTFDEAIECIRNFNNKGYRVIINSIATASNDEEAIMKVRDNYISLIESISENKLNAGITIRTTNLGIGYSYKEAEKALRAVLQKAQESNVGIEIDMEERPFVEKTIKLASEMIEEGLFLRLCVQSGVKGIYGHVARLLNAAKDRVTFRMVTGSCYKETLELSEPETIKQFYRLMLLCGKNSAIGTHVTERLLCAKAHGMETQILMGFEKTQPEDSIDTIYACFGDWRTNSGIRGYIQRREQSVSS